MCAQKIDCAFGILRVGHCALSKILQIPNMSPVSYGVGGWLGVLCAYLWARKYNRNFIDTLPMAGMGAVFGSSMFYIFAELLVVVGHMILFTINTMLRTDILIFIGIPILSFELLLHFKDKALMAALGIQSDTAAAAAEIHQDAIEAAAAETTPPQSDTETSNDSDSATNTSNDSDTATSASDESATAGDAEDSTSTESGEDCSSNTDSASDTKDSECATADTNDTIPVSVWPVQ
jgi:hypothetical protein